MKDPWYCTECHCYHDVHITKPVYLDVAGNCISADDWRGMHYDEEFGTITDDAWQKLAEDMTEELDRPLHKVFNDCGHMTLELNEHPMSWCKGCLDRREVERYDY